MSKESRSNPDVRPPRVPAQSAAPVCTGFFPVRSNFVGACSWPKGEPLMVRYHDKEWGCPVRNDKKIFEFLVLESAQAGLSWLTILRKREGYRRAFANFEPKQIARFGAWDIVGLLKNSSIVRNRLKIEAAINK